jgi:hypothetical protein
LCPDGSSNFPRNPQVVVVMNTHHGTGYSIELPDSNG